MNRLIKKIAVFTGAGISAESGIRTFRDHGGLWEEYAIEEVASPQAWEANRELVLKFYNDRRRALLEAQPNEGHLALSRLQQFFEVNTITQNVDDLHERAGSGSVLHLHGELLKVRSCRNPDYVIPWTSDLKSGDLCPAGAQLRPHIVWFGEQVPELSNAARIIKDCDCLIITGTSLQVYPAAGLIYYARLDIPKFFIDPAPNLQDHIPHLEIIRSTATEGLPKLVDRLIAQSDV
jgi:NAD-dependent deacetylase